MKVIKDITRRFHQLRNAEHFDVNEAIVRELGGKLTSIPVLENLVLIYVGYFKKEDIVFKRWRALQETTSLRELDRLRDNLTISVRLIIEAAEYNSDPAIKEAGKQLNFIFKNYRNPNRRPYKENTALIINLLQDFEKAENRPAVRLLGLEETLNELKKDNEDFSILYYERARKKEDERNEASLYVIRRKVDESLQNLINAINPLYAANELETNDPQRNKLLADVIDNINSVINQAEDDYFRRVQAKKPASKQVEPELEVGGPYFMNVVEQGDDVDYYFIDKDPEGFTRHFANTSLEGSELYAQVPKEGEESKLFFDEYIDEDGQLIGFRVASDRPSLGLGAETSDAVMVKDGKVILRFSLIRFPMVLD